MLSLSEVLELGLKMMEKVWLKSYPAHVPEQIDTRKYHSLVDLFCSSVGQHATSPAFSNMGKVISYAEVDHLTRQFAAYLIHGAGLQPGDRIALMMPNLLQYPVALFGALFTYITGVNTLFNAILNHPDIVKVDFSCLKLTLGSGMAIQKSVAERWKAATGKPLVEAYGLTETSPAVHPKVLETGVIGVSNEQSGEVVKAFVVRSDDSLTEAELKAYCRGVLAAYKCPKLVVFVDGLPKSNVGKILRKELRLL